MISRLLPWAALPFLPLSASATPVAEIRIDPRHRLGPVSPYLTGSCLEDVNHEVYGGISAQMVFGESFQEPDQSNGISRC